MIGYILNAEGNFKKKKNGFNGAILTKNFRCQVDNKEKQKESLTESIDNEKGPSLQAIAEKLNCLLSPNKTYNIQKNEHQKVHLESTFHVAIVFCKPLLHGKLSVECSRRISTLFIQLRYRKIKPDLIVFMGSNRSTRELSCATAGYLFFRHLLTEYNLKLENYKIVVQDKYEDSRSNISNLIKNIQVAYGPECISKIHFTLVSSDYHLIRLSEIHKFSPKQSILSPLSYNKAAWTFLFAAYPFCVSPDPTIAFLGRIRVLANELSIVLINLNGYINSNELFARENYTRLCEINKKLRTMLRIMFDDRQRPDYHRSALEITSEQWEILEQSLCHLHDIQVTLTPLLNGESIDRRLLQKVQEVFANSIKVIKLTVDPDRPLESNEWQLHKRK